VKRSRADWEKLISEFERSGESQQQFCTRRSVADATLQYWLRRVRRSGQEKGVSVVPVRLSDGASRRLMVEADLGSLRIRFEEGLSPEYIAAVLRALAMPC
jgi:hypothetical protein